MPPTITLTNTSTGAHLNLCTWWIEVFTPNGIPIHQGSVTSPDITTNNWSTFVIPETWQTPFGAYPGGGQIEFSCSVPYLATLYVKDSLGNIYSFSISQTICRPNGNTDLTLGNFGSASINVQVQCDNRRVKGIDKTNYAYQTLLGTPQDQEWTMTYPMDASGNLPTPATASNADYVLFGINYAGEGYGIYLNTFSTYIFPNGATIKIQYKSQSNQRTSFAVWCNISRCNLASEVNKLYKLANVKCGQVEYPGLIDKAVKVSLLLHALEMAIDEPLCGIDVPALIKDIEKLGEFNCNCCGNNGVNFGNAIPIPSNSGGCCPSSTPIWGYGTTSNPANCATGGYFPAQVYAPNGTTFIGMAYNANDIVSLMNSNAQWIALGTAFNTGSCKVGFYRITPGTTIPSLIVGTTGIGTGYGHGSTPPCINNSQYYLAVLTDKCSGNPTVTMPTNVFVNYGGSDIALGSIATPAALLAALNSQGAKPASFSYSLGNIPGEISILVHNNNCPSMSGLLTIKGDNDCGGGGGVIVVNVIDKDTTNPPALCPGSYFPANVYEPNGTTLIGNANNVTDLINLINGDTAWNLLGTAAFNGSQCTVTFTPNPGITTIPVIKVKISSGCVGSTINETIQVTDPCTVSPLSPSSYPCTLYVDWIVGGGLHSLGIVANKIALIAALNADSFKPGVVTVVDNVSIASDVIINVSDCTYTSTPSIGCDLTSTDYLLLGADHGNLINVKPAVASEIAVGLKTMTRLDIIPSPANQHIRWHTIKIGNYLIDSETDTGKIRFFDVTNPSMPVLINTITLSSVVGSCFTGIPQSLFWGGSLRNSLYCLYFPTDYYAGMTTDLIYVVESVTGSIWKISMATGEIAAFQDNKLLGKCPRVLTNGKLFFTQEGDLETFTASSTVPAGSIVILDTTDFTSGGLSEKVIFANNLQNVWAASFDGIDTIYFTGTDVNTISGAGGSVAKYTVSSDTVVAHYLHIFPGANIHSRCNTTYFAGRLIICVYHMYAGSSLIFSFDVSTFGTTNTYINFIPSPDAAAQYPFNFKPLGNCYGIATSTPGTVNLTGILTMYKLDGTKASQMTLGDGSEIYNVIPFGGFSTYTPNSFV